MSGNWVKLHRKIRDWEWYTDNNTKSVFLELLLTASYEDNRFRGYEVKRGQVVTGRKKLAKDLKLSERAVRTALNHLKSTNEIAIKTTNKFSIITIVNYESYQDRDDATDQQNDQPAVQRPTSNRPTTDHTQEGKEIKEGKEGKNISKTLPVAKKKRGSKGKTKFSMHNSISPEQYKAILEREDLADGDRAWLLRQVQTMGDHFNGRGELMVDWASTLRNWCRKARNQFSDSPHGKNGKAFNRPKTFKEAEEEWQDEQFEKFLKE